jgi:DNA repair exonuclease SbcCD ATPase subunit
MWYLDKFRAEGFMSYKELEYDFNKGATTLIYGVNHDELGADSNGAGKSAIVKGITIALVDLPDKNLTKDEYINDFVNVSKLQLDLVNPVHNKTLSVVRIFKRSKDNQAILFEDGVQQEKLTSVGEVNKRILALLDISKEDILNYYIINQDNSNSFFEATDASQKATITRFVNADLVDKAITAVQTDIDTKNKQIDKVKAAIATNDTKIEVITKQIDYERNERSKDLEEEKTKYQQKVLSLQDKITNSKTEANKYANELTKLEGQLVGLEESLDETSTAEAKESLTKNKKKQADFDLSLGELRKPIAEINRIMAGETKCPKCGWTWVEDGDGRTLKELNDQKEEFERLIQQIQEASKKTEKRIAKLREAISQSNTQQEELEALRAEISRNKRKFSATKQSVEDYNTEIKLYRKKIDEMTNSANSTVRITNLEAEITQISQDTEELQDALKVLNDEKNDLTFWNINLGIKGFKTFLVNKTLLSVEGYVNLFLSKFKVDLIVKIQGFKTLKTGEIRENIAVSISRDGGDTWKPFKRHSGGQRRRIDVCGILTVQAFINNTSKYGGLDLLVLDEFFEGLDTKGQQGVLKILVRTGVTTLVISHNNNDIGAENQIWVNYKDKTSTLSYEKGKFREDKQSQSPSLSKKKSLSKV